ncbi:MAG: hypothetical protein IPF58_08035 [Saprospirales bacterium]|nr:hypothetical protein [Saprospirales bacterium]
MEDNNQDPILEQAIVNETIETEQDSDGTVIAKDEGFKQVISVIKEIFGIIGNYALIFLIPIIIMGLYGYYKSKQVKPTFTAKITFFLSEDRPQIPGFGAGNFSNILQTTNNNFNNPKKLKEYSFTEKVGSKMVFKKYVFQDREDYLGNHYLKLFSNYKSSYFKEFTTVKEMSVQDYLVFKRILGGIRSMVTVDYDEAEIYSITVITGNEEFSKLLCECFYENLIDYYIERATRKASITVRFLDEKLAYVKAQLENSEYNLADYKDKANNLVTYKADLLETRYVRNKALLEGLYGETARSLEAAKTNEQSIMPLFQTIDEPHLPLTKNVTSTKNQLIMFTLIGFFIDIFAIIGIYFHRHFWPDLKKVLQSA